MRMCIAAETASHREVLRLDISRVSSSMLDAAGADSRLQARRLGDYRFHINHPLGGFLFGDCDDINQRPRGGVGRVSMRMCIAAETASHREVLRLDISRISSSMLDTAEADSRLQAQRPGDFHSFKNLPFAKPVDIRTRYFASLTRSPTVTTI